jgi:hypothetical protein
MNIRLTQIWTVPWMFDQFTSVLAMDGNLRMASAAAEATKPWPMAGSTVTEVPNVLEQRTHA